MTGFAKSSIAACVCALLLACSNSHGANAGTSGSNWLRCAKLVDCAGARDAVACSSAGFCVDADGERITREDDQIEAADSAGSAEPDGRAVLQERCLWGIDALLAQVGGEAEGRTNCGQYATNDKVGFTGGLRCFESAFTTGRAVEISFDLCRDCYAVTTYLATARGEGFVITREAAKLGPDELKEISVSTCDELHVEFEPRSEPLAPGERYPFIGCSSSVERYRCQQPLEAPNLDEPRPDVPVTPLKLGDIASTGNIARETLHLYVSNQSVGQPLVNIDVMIDDVRVVTGDFDVGSQHSWFEFEILVPIGSHTLRASSFGAPANLQQTIDVRAERWAVLEYWNDGEVEIPKFSLSLHDEPVSFQ
jgi:hypothetical protein